MATASHIGEYTMWFIDKDLFLIKNELRSSAKGLIIVQLEEVESLGARHRLLTELRSDLLFTNHDTYFR